jgi:hypothetical protein
MTDAAKIGSRLPTSHCMTKIDVNTGRLKEEN